MGFKSQKFENVIVISPETVKIISDNSVEFRDELADILKTEDEVILDLSGVRFIDSSGLGALINCYKNLDKRKDIILCGLNKELNSLFAITRLDRIFNIYNSKKEALADRDIFPS